MSLSKAPGKKKNKSSDASAEMPGGVFIPQHPGMKMYDGLNMEQGVA